jgi:biopolymer transport protein TolQ
MGAVYLAEDAKLRRKVALKVPHFTADTRAPVLERFQREARLAAGIDHPNFCPVHDVDEIEGIHFFSELKPGGLKENGPAVATQSALTATQLEALRMVLAKEVAAERDGAARFIPWLATFGSVSPLLGLLGTVLGVMDAFIGIAVGGSGNIAAVAPGVAEALVTTVAGLAVAVPSVMAYNLFVNRLGLFAGELEGFAQEIIGTLAREGRL